MSRGLFKHWGRELHGSSWDDCSGAGEKWLHSSFISKVDLEVSMVKCQGMRRPR